MHCNLGVAKCIFLLTGLSKEGLELLQCYVDLTGDVQTACFIMAHASPELMKDGRVKQWVERYLSHFKSFCRLTKF